MAFSKPGGGLALAARALGSASTVAHFLFFAVFVWRFIVGNGFRLISLTLALVALAGLVMSFVGKALLKHGGRTRARVLGFWLVGGSATLASVLLILSSGD